MKQRTDIDAFGSPNYVNVDFVLFGDRADILKPQLIQKAILGCLRG